MSKHSYFQKKKCIVCNKLITNEATNCKKHRPVTWASKVKESLAREDVKDKMRVAKKGKTYDKANSWKGDKCGYAAKHVSVKSQVGNPKKCKHCGKVGEKANGRWNVHWANVSGEYKREAEDYIGLCRKCHYWFDRSRKPYTPKWRVMIEFNGERKSLTEWANYIGISKSTLSARINRYGIPLERALSSKKQHDC
ncbi:MAG: hypothetical protein WC803_12970 [Sphingomonas sp.]|jgi:hypothetical protein